MCQEESQGCKSPAKPTDSRQQDCTPDVPPIQEIHAAPIMIFTTCVGPAWQTLCGSAPPPLYGMLTKARHLPLRATTGFFLLFSCPGDVFFSFGPTWPPYKGRDQRATKRARGRPGFFSFDPPHWLAFLFLFFPFTLLFF